MFVKKLNNYKTGHLRGSGREGAADDHEGEEGEVGADEGRPVVTGEVAPQRRLVQQVHGQAEAEVVRPAGGQNVDALVQLQAHGGPLVLARVHGEQQGLVHDPRDHLFQGGCVLMVKYKLSL